MALRLSMLGELVVERDGAAVALPRSKKMRAMLAYLVLTGREHRRERLCTLLWDVADDPRAALRWVLSRLRKVVDEPDLPRVQASRTSVSFNVEGMEIDVLAVRALVADGIGDLPSSDLAELTQQLKPELLEGLEFEDFDTFQAWLLAEREALATLRVEALEELVARHPHEPETRLPWLRELVAARALDEALRADLVRALVALDRYREAKQQVQAGKRALEDVGRRSSGALGAALRSVPEPAPEPAPAVFVPADPRPPPSSVGPPRARTRFVGREALRKQLVEVLQPRTLVVLLGPSGVGKTRLAAEVAAQWDRCVWCDLMTARTADEMVERVARVFHASVPTRLDRMAALGRAWSQRGGLLVLDNLEQIEGHEPLLEALWQAGPEAPLLVTTQRRTGLVGERVVEVPPLAAEEARELFVQRATAIHGTFATDETTLEALVERLDRLPLALELAAARTRLMGTSQLLTALERPRSPTGKGRHASIEDAVAWSWGLLSEPAKAALVQLSVFSGSFDLDAALAVVDVPGDAIEVIQLLRDQSLLHAETPGEAPDTVLLRLTHSVRSWASAQREKHDPSGLAAERHADWVVEHVKQRIPFYPPEQLRQLRRIRPELERAAEWAVQARNAEQALWLLMGVADLAWSWGPPSAVPELASQVLNLFDDDEAGQARTRVLRGAFVRRLGDRDAALADLEWAEAAAERTADPEASLEVVSERYRWAFERGEYTNAARYARRAYDALVDSNRASLRLSWRAKMLMNEGRSDAPAAWRMAIAAAHRQGDVLKECHGHLSLADLCRRSGEPMTARPHLEAAVRLAQQGQDLSAIARAHHGLMLLLQERDSAAAFDHSVEAVEGWERMDSQRRAASACLGACLTAPDRATAETLGKRALQIGLERADDGLIAQAYLALGRRAESHVAIGYLRAAMEIVRQHPLGSVAVSVYVALAERYLADGRIAQAEAALAEVAEVPGELPLLELERAITQAWARRLEGDAVDSAEIDAQMEALAVPPESRLGRLRTAAFTSDERRHR
ncbi:MAG: AAA family ATPase [Myxococcota bacterium]